MFLNAYEGKTVWLSGHTGFKGSWLSLWLLGLGAKVHGFSLPAPTTPSLFEELELPKVLEHEVGDVRDAAAVKSSIARSEPDFVFHLAAQPLVRRSYVEPLETYQTNVMGTLNVLHALQSQSKPCSAVMITTDKVYENREWLHGYREEDPLGGHDPYSSSKAAAEIAIASYRNSFCSAPGAPLRIASARAGNVIGGGDWAEDRIVPDCVRALQKGQPILVRNRHSTRPWQHVLEPLSGYLWLGAKLAEEPANPVYRSAFNFGPTLASNRTVAELVTRFLQAWPGEWVDGTQANAVHEARLLNLSTDKAFQLLKWSSVWDFDRTAAETARWYQQRFERAADVAALTKEQIARYVSDARSAEAPWT